MIRRVRIYLVLAAVIYSFLLFSISDVWADSPTTDGSNQMSTNGTQTLTASGGCSGPYTWTIVVGSGFLNNTTVPIVGPSVTYKAPGTNANCANNPTIRVTDACGNYTDLQIAVNGGSNGIAGIASLRCENGMVEGYCSAQLWGEYLMCDGRRGRDIPGMPERVCSPGFSQNACGVWMDYQTIWANLCTQATAAVICAPDMRSDESKAAGCCPASLPGGGGTGPKTNDTGDPCSNAPAESSTNLRSGNLFHSQDVNKLTLSYNSIDTNEGPLGKKWTHQYNIKLTPKSDNNTITLNTEAGNIFYFRLSSGIYYPEAITGDTSQIIKNANGTYTQTKKNGTIYNYSTTGKLTSIQDRNGKTTTLAYSGSDLTGITDFNGRTTTITNTGGKITAITDPMGRTYTIGYTGGYITTITDPLNNAWQYAYNAAGRMLTKTDPAGRQVTYTYDTAGKLLTSTDPEGKTRAMSYTQTGQTTHTEKDGGVWTYKYDPVFMVKKEVTDPKGNTIKYDYDSKRNLIKKTEPDGSAATYAYDGSSNLTATTDPMGKTTTYTYNALNLVTGITDPKGNTTRYGYNANGDLTSITDAANAVTQYQYDTRGNITSITNPVGKTTTMTYDAKNNLISVTDPKNGAVTMAYDNAGNMLTQTDALNNTTAFQYNSLNQLTRITDPKGYVTAYTYDYKGNRLTATDADSNTTRYIYNYRDQLTRITDALNNITNLAYSGAGCASCGTGVEKLIAVTDARNHTTAYEYDTTGKLVRETDPLGKITTYTYDGTGNLLTRTNPDNKTITYTYDLNRRLTRKQYSDSSITAFQYDDTGNMTYAGNQSIAYNFAYDGNKRITAITDSNSRSIQYNYDAAGNRTTMVTPENRTVSYGYDNGNLLTRITTDLGNFTFTYDANNRRITRSHPNGTISTYSYDEKSRMTGIITTKNSTSIDSVTYTHDNVGNRITKTQPTVNYSYGYDAVYRLTQAAKTGGSHQPETYTYDQVGNRLTRENETPPTNNETTQYIYDDENRLTGVQITQNSKVRQLTFTYDPFGRRIAETLIKDEIGTECDNPNICPRTTHYLYDDKNIILEYNTGNEIQARYTHGPGIDEPLSTEFKTGTGYTPYFYHADGLGSITALSNAQGNIVQRYEYDSFGIMNITMQGNIKQPYTYTSREYDSETGMYFYRARYYDPKVGRFVTKDPIGFAGGDSNLYGYVSNNPLLYLDPYGLGKNCGSGPFNWAVSDTPGGFDFSLCCEKHDYCYDGKSDDGTETLCRPKDQCDDEFKKCMREKCKKYRSYIPDSEIDSRTLCERWADTYWWWVSNVGGGAFDNARINSPCQKPKRTN
jgi:RHS repeat-associated protein